MAVPNIFSNGTVADADEVNENFAYLVANSPLDGSSVATITDSVSGVAGGLFEGTKSNAFDKDNTTYFQVYADNSTSASGTLTTLIDFGRVMWGGIYSYHMEFTFNNASGGTCTIAYSADNSNWTTIESFSTNNVLVAKTTTNLFYAARYLRVTHTASGAAARITTNIYEAHMHGY